MKASTPTRTNARTPIIVSLLFLSGATGLVYELTWSKRLANVLGNTGQAHAIVLSTFMGGLALGAFLFGRTADRARRPLALYGALELGVGLFAFAMPALLSFTSQSFVRVAPELNELGRLLVRLGLAGTLLLPPTVLMGGTLPVLMRHLTERLSVAQRTLSLLYAVNSLGAAAGCLTAGLFLVPRLGLTMSERLAGVGNVVLGLAAVVIGWRQVRANAPQPSSQEREQRYATSSVRAALVGTALAGFTSMTYETVWIRVLSIVLGGTSYAFTLILSAFILGIALGSLWLASRPAGNALRLLAFVQWGLVIAVLLSMGAYARLPWFFIEVHDRLSHGPQTWSVFLFLSFVACGALLIPPAFLLGASFPAAARVTLEAVGTVGARLGTTYLWNTVGTVIGALGGGLLLLPTLGLEGTLALALVANLCASAVAMLAPDSGFTRSDALRWLTPVAVVLVVTVMATHGWASMLAASGRYREWNRGFESYAQFTAEVRERSTVEFYRDDVFASVLMGSQRTGRRYLRINGKIDGSNGTDIDTQILAGQLGVLLHPRAVKRVLLVGVGAGITMGSLLTHPIERLDVVEISPAVLEAAQHFKEDHHDAFADPRLHVHLEDARTFLELSTEPYDLIVSVPSNPWVSGVAGLFSADFFEMAKTKLAPGGRLVQWIHTYESSEALVRVVVRTLRASFTHGTTWVGPDDLVLLASQEPQTLELETLATRMARPAVKDDLSRLHIDSPVVLLGRQVHSDAAQLRFAGKGAVNTDDLNVLEYASPLAYFVSASVQVPDSRRSPTESQELELARVLAGRALTAQEARSLHASLAWVHAPDDPLVRSAAKAWLEAEPASTRAALAYADALNREGDVMLARSVLAPFAETSDDAEVHSLWVDVNRRVSIREGAPWVSTPHQAP